MKSHSIQLFAPILFIILFIHLNSCEMSEKESPDFIVEVSIEEPVEITANTAIVGGNVKSTMKIISKGILWHTDLSSMGIDNDGTVFNDTRKSDHGIGSGKFSSIMDFLSPNTTYFIRAYAIDDFPGEVYLSEPLSFTTLEKPVVFGNGVKDIDGNEYTTVIINKREWMAENLYTTHLNDGTPIQLQSNQTLWDNLVTPGYCWYDNMQAVNGSIYGALYNGHAVATGRLCPAGWHVPTYWVWKSLFDYLGGEDLAGAKLKKEKEYPGYGIKTTNEVGFSALLGGRRQGRFYNLSDIGFWWSSTSLNNLTDTYSIHMYDNEGFAKFTYNNKADGLSVRCIKD